MIHIIEDRRLKQNVATFGTAALYMIYGKHKFDVKTLIPGARHRYHGEEVTKLLERPKPRGLLSFLGDVNVSNHGTSAVARVV